MSVRSTRLLWIRDGSNWLVGLSTGALVLSATYFYDHFARSPRFLDLLVTAWVLLAVSTLSGVFTSFSAWKNLKEAPIAGQATPPLGAWLTRSYTVMMWTFLSGYLILASILILNVFQSAQAPMSDTEVFPVDIPLPSFSSGSQTESGEFVQAVCKVRRTLEQENATSAIVIGRHDTQPISPKTAIRVGSNFDLARHRAERTRELLLDRSLCTSKPPHFVLTIPGGPTHGLDRSQSGQEMDAALAQDRRVDIYGIRIPQKAEPAPYK